MSHNVPTLVDGGVGGFVDSATRYKRVLVAGRIIKINIIMKKTLEIRRNLKQREHLENLVHDLKNDLKETERLIERYKKTVEKLNYDLLIWDEFSNNTKN